MTDTKEEIDRSLPPKDDHVLQIHSLKLKAGDTGAVLGAPVQHFYFRATNIKLLEDTLPVAVVDGKLNVPGISYSIERGVRGGIAGLEIIPIGPHDEIPADAHRVIVAIPQPA